MGCSIHSTRPATDGPAVQIDVFTVFPELIETFAAESLLGKAQESDLVQVAAHDLRAATTDKHRSVDAPPFGGGAGMVLMPEPVFAAVEQADPPRPLFLMSPSGRRFDQSLANELATTPGFSLLCGRYEGVDERIAAELCDDAISIGDFVIAGGEVAALVIIEAVVRLVPGVMGNDESAGDESFMTGLLEYPHYTRPADFRGSAVPEVLRSGDHARVDRWRRAQALARTIERRPDLIETRGGISEDERLLLREFDLE